LHAARLFHENFRYDPLEQIIGSETRGEQQSRAIEDLGPGQFGQCAESTLVACAKLDLAYERIDAGMAFGRNRDPDYLAMNPNGRVPTLGRRRFCALGVEFGHALPVLEYGQGSPLYPQAPKRRTSVDRWLDWTLSTLQPVDRPVFWALVRTPVEQRDMVANPARCRRRGRANGAIVDAQFGNAALHRGR